MTERRLLESGATDFEASLLQSAINEAPSAELSAKMMAPLAAGAALSGAASGALVKWVSAGAGALLVGGMIFLASAPSRNETSVPKEAAPAEKPLSGTVHSPKEKTAPRPEVEIKAEPSVTVHETEVQNKVTAAAPKSMPSTDSLADEMRLLDRARSLLKNEKKPESALAVLNEYEKKYPQGKLLPEATVLRVAALEASGAQQKATELKDEFLRAHPQSAHKKQLETREGH